MTKGEGEKLSHHQRGDTLIEVIIAIALLGVVLAALFGALSVAVLGSQGVEESTRAVALARSQVEFVKQQSYTEPASYALISAPEGFEIQASGETLTPSYLQHITVQVLYGDRSFTLEAYKVNRVPGVPGIPPLTAALWVVDEETDQVFQYSEAGTFVGTLSLTDANRDSKGITTDGTSFWVLDEHDKKVYRYNTSGQLQDSFALTTPSDHLEGITTDGSSLWVVDKDSGVFRYSTSGTFQNDSFSLDAENSHPEGITTDGTSIWVVDKDVDKVFHYSLTGSLLGSFSVSPATHPEGITTDGTSIWVVDKDTDYVYKFDLTGAPLRQFGLELPGNGKAGGLAR